jgi:hypothetical protein
LAGKEKRRGIPASFVIICLHPLSGSVRILGEHTMKHFALLVTSLFAALVFSSCCGSPFSSCGGDNVATKSCADCGKPQAFPHVGCENDRFVEKEITQYVEEQVVVEGKGGMGAETITVRRPVTRTVREAVPCGDCGSKFCATPDCCGIVPVSVLSRATVQGSTGEPHVGLIPTMKVLVDGARETDSF